MADKKKQVAQKAFYGEGHEVWFRDPSGDMLVGIGYAGPLGSSEHTAEALAEGLNVLEAKRAAGESGSLPEAQPVIPDADEPAISSAAKPEAPSVPPAALADRVSLCADTVLMLSDFIRRLTFGTALGPAADVLAEALRADALGSGASR